MKITYLAQHVEECLPGTMMPCQDVPAGVLFHVVLDNGCVVESYINFYDEEGNLYDHKDSRALSHYDIAKHRKIGKGRSTWRGLKALII